MQAENKFSTEPLHLTPGVRTGPGPRWTASGARKEQSPPCLDRKPELAAPVLATSSRAGQLFSRASCPHRG